MSNTSLHNKQSKEQILKWIEDYQQNESEEAQTNLVLNYTRLVESIAVVKANAYGHGDIEVANAALNAGAKVLAVATPGYT